MPQKAVQLGDAGLFYLHCCAAVSQAADVQNTEYSRSLAAESYFYGAKCCCCYYYCTVMTTDIHIWHLRCLSLAKYVNSLIISNINESSKHVHGSGGTG